jgi:conjugal transfer pilin signal peptidase TrbI
VSTVWGVRQRNGIAAFMRRVRRFLMPLLGEISRHPLIACSILAIWGAAIARLMFDPIPHLPILFNWTPSLPVHVVWISYGVPSTLARGEFIVYAFAGEAQQRYPGLRAQPFFKQILGVPGDRVRVMDRRVFVNGIAAGFAKTQTFDRTPLQPIDERVIPPDCYYVRGTHPDSFDSRYRASGLVCTRHIIGKAISLF